MSTIHATPYEPALGGLRKRILFVTDDAAELQKMETLATGLGEPWQAAFASTWKSALEMMAQTPFDAVLSDLGMNRATGLEFLTDVWKQHPKTIRFVAADRADSELITGCALDSHQFVPKPIRIEDLQAATERVCRVDTLIGSGPIKELVSQIRSFPSIPSVYFDVMKEIGSASASPQSIGELIAKDLAMTTKMIQTVNSAYFGLQRQITDPGEAVMVLGVDTVRALVLGVHAFAQADKIKPLYFSADRIWRHSLAVAETAKKITLWKTGDAQMADAAYTAGLLHDIGKLILATNFDTQYGNALALAKKQNVPPTEMERNIFGMTHAETGAYLLSLWGLPLPIIEATALHHAPSKCQATGFSPLTAIHIANVFEHEANPGQDGFIDPTLDHDYLAELKLEDDLDDCRAHLRGAKPQAKPNPSTTAAPAVASAKTTTREPRGNSGPPWWKFAVPVGAAATLAIAFCGWKLLNRTSVPVQARTAQTQEEKATRDAPTPTTTPAPTPATVEPKATPSVATPSSVSPVGVDQPRKVAPSETTAAPAGTVRKVETRGFGGLKVQGVIYSATTPTVIINGKTLRRGELIQGARVTEINRQGVFLEFGDEKRFLPLAP